MPKQPDKELVSTSVIRSGNMVSITKGFNKQTQPYENAKVSVTVTCGVNPSKEDLIAIKTTIETVDNIVEREIVRQLKELS